MMKKIGAIVLVLFTNIAAAQPGTATLKELLAKASRETDTNRVNTLIDVAATYSYEGNHDSSDYYSNEILSLSQKLNYAKGISIAYNNFGISHMVKGEYDQSLSALLKGLTIAEKAGLQKNIMVTSMNVATIYTFQEEYRLAIPLLKKVFDYTYAGKNMMRSSGVATNLGLCYQKINFIDSARYFYDRALRLLDSIPSATFNENQKAEFELFKTSCLPKTADFYLTIHQPQVARQMLRPFWEEIKSSPNAESKLSLLTELCKTYTALNIYDSVLYFSHIAADLVKNSDHPDAAQDIYFYTAKASAAKGMYKEAYENQVAAEQIKDSLYNKEKFKAIKDMQVKYETEKKEQQIEALNKEKKSQQLIIFISVVALLVLGVALSLIIRSKRLQQKVFASEKLLEKNEAEKKMAALEQTALRAQMNPHFIFNSLNSVQRFIITNDLEGVNSYLTTFAGLIRQTLENSGKKFISLSDEIKYLEVYLQLEKMRSNRQFTYTITVDDHVDPDATFIPNMIIQPFVENAINHAMPVQQNGEGQISLHFYGGRCLRCEIVDNGPGFKHTTSKEYAKNYHQPMGSTITQKRIGAFNAHEAEKIEIETADLSDNNTGEHGTKISIVFPLKQVSE